LDDYMRELASHNRFVSKHGGRQIHPTLEDFQERLLRLSDAVADNWVDGEEWWVWDSLRDVYPHLGSFWENTGGEDYGAEILLPRYLNIEEDVPAEWAAFREELAKDRAEVAAWLESMKLKEKTHFVKVIE
jgi:hypothetical protein